MTRQVHRPVIGDALARLSQTHVGLKVSWSQPTGEPARVLAAAARRCRLVVVGSRGRGAVADAFLGSTTNRLIAQTRCPVVVLRADTPVPRPQAPVVVGLECARPFVRVLETAFEQAGGRHLDLVVVHMLQADDSLSGDGSDLRCDATDEAQQREIERLATSLADVARSHAPVQITTLSVPQGAAEELRRRVADASLAVVGARGHGEFGSAVLTPVNQRVIRSAGCPVLVVRDGRKPLLTSPSRTAAGATS